LALPCRPTRFIGRTSIRGAGDRRPRLRRHIPAANSTSRARPGPRTGGAGTAAWRRRQDVDGSTVSLDPSPEQPGSAGGVFAFPAHDSKPADTRDAGGALCGFGVTARRTPAASGTRRAFRAVPTRGTVPGTSAAEVRTLAITLHRRILRHQWRRRRAILDRLVLGTVLLAAARVPAALLGRVPPCCPGIATPL
jgi:hypothetical protein